jgi:hypothetical protein
MSASFDVLVTSMDALNAQLRGLRQDMSRGADAQGRFGGGGDADADRPLPPWRSADDYDPGAGRTSLSNLRNTAGNVRRLSLGQAAQAAAALLSPPAAQRSPAAPAGAPAAPPSQGFNFFPPPPLGAFQPPAAPPAGGGSPPVPPGGGAAPPAAPPGPGGQPPAPQGGQPQRPPIGQGGWTNTLLAGASRIPYVGTAMAIMTAGSKLYQSEREKNRLYQGMEGGSNAAGFGERAHEEIYRWSMPGMSGDMSRRSFKGVTALGYTGKSQTREGRQDALNFVYHNYNARGMDVEESMSVLQSASRDATVTFGELSSALKEVSDTAGKAGVNAKVMRAQFQGLLESSINTGAGPGAAQLAGTFASTQASYGREFQNSDMSGQLSRGYQYMIGAQYGVSPGQVQGLMRNKPDEYARMVSGSQRSMIEMQLGPKGIADLEALIKKYGNTQQAIPIIEQEFLNSHPEIDLNIIADTLSGALTGVQLDNSNVMDWIIQQLAGNTAAAHVDQAAKTKPVDANNTAGAQSGKYGLYEAPKDTPDKYKADPRVFQRMNVKSDFFNNEKNKAGETYAKGMEESGKRDPVLEAILQNVKEPNKTNVRVSTSKGERIVSLEEAMRLFPNELAKGDVQFIDGDQAGKSVSQVVNGQVDANRDISKEMTNVEGQKIGQTPEEYEKNYGPIKKAGGGDVVNQRVTVGLTDEAKRLLTVLSDQPSATGYPPFNTNSSQGSRP